VARRKRITSLGIGALAVLFGGDGLLRAIRDVRSGDLAGGTAAASQQPYGTFLRLFCFSFLIAMGYWFIQHALRTRPIAGAPPHDKSKL